jgi:hypothetical protein
MKTFNSQVWTKPVLKCPARLRSERFEPSSAILPGVSKLVPPQVTPIRYRASIEIGSYLIFPSSVLHAAVVVRASRSDPM